MRLINVATFKLEEFPSDIVPRYAILSHTWGNDNEEVSFRDIEEGKIEKAGTGSVKLKGCCLQAKKDGLQYAWIDSCCIDKTNAVELGEAINSMFQWYKNAAVCYTYLSDVPGDDIPRDPRSKFFSSRWFQRGWTLQELLAPKELRFFNSEWSHLGTRREMSIMVAKITGIPRPFLVGIAELRDASIAQRMSWAAKRVTRRKEDIAYSLLGIFGVTMAMIYGEGDQAFIRLQQEIMRETRDDSILAWGLSLKESTPSDPDEIVSGGFLAATPLDFENCRNIVSREHDSTPINPFDIFGGSLRIYLPLFTTLSGETFGILRCGPGNNSNQVVGIPLQAVTSSGTFNEYIKPERCYLVQIPELASDVSIKLIHIRKERKSDELKIVQQRNYFYIEESHELNLELIDVEPRTHWQKDIALITTPGESDEDVIQRTLTRFRCKEKESPDFLVALEFEIQKKQPQTRWHVMISSRDTELESIAQRFTFMRQEAFGKHSASNGILNLDVTLRQEFTSGQSNFVVRLGAAPNIPEVTIDATLEMRQLDLKLDLINTVRAEVQIRQKIKQFGQDTKTTVNLELMNAQLEIIEEKLKKLGEEKQLLLDGLERESRKIEYLIEIKKQQDKLSEDRLDIQHCLDDLLQINSGIEEAPKHDYESAVKLLLTEEANKDVTPLGWAAINGYEAIVTLLNNIEVSLEEKDSEGRTPLMLAIMKGHEAVVKLLLEHSAELEAVDFDGKTPLWWAAYNGHEAIVKLLLEHGAEIEAMDSLDKTPLLWAAYKGHEAVVKLLLEHGAKIEAMDFMHTTPLSLAATNGHEAVVKLLLEHGAEIEAMDSLDKTPLLWAAYYGYEAVVKLLLEHGAKLEAVDFERKTPLSFAAAHGHEATVKLLLEHGAKLRSVYQSNVPS